MSMKKIPVAPCSNLITSSQTSRDLRSFVCKPFESWPSTRVRSPLELTGRCRLLGYGIRGYWDAYGRATVVPSSRQNCLAKEKIVSDLLVVPYVRQVQLAKQWRALALLSCLRPSGGDIPVPVRSPKSSTVERG